VAIHLLGAGFESCLGQGCLSLLNVLCCMGTEVTVTEVQPSVCACH